MLEVSGIRLQQAQLSGLEPGCERAVGLVRRQVRSVLHLPPDDITSVAIRRRSVDARKRGQVMVVYTVRLTLRGHANAERALIERMGRRGGRVNLKVVEDRPFVLPQRMGEPLRRRPVVVGAGCAGLFCALALARAGLQPLLVERGDAADERTRRVRHFDETGELDCQSNIQFGLGGAGTFSDGKLSTGTKSPAHRAILEMLVDAGADPSILWDSHPHVGSDVLPRVVTRLVEQIREAGGEVRFRCQMTDVEIAGASDGRHVDAVVLQTCDPQTGLVREERVACDNVVLACGHSARDTFGMLVSRGVPLERKTFAMGVRIEHLQRSIDRALYGAAAGDVSLGAAPYKLVAHVDDDRSAFSFCMCPGGQVVAAASEEGHVVTNGASNSARDGVNANSGLLANVRPEDLPGDDVLAGVELQRACERRAFELGGGDFRAPAQLTGDFLAGRPSSGAGQVTPTYPRGVTWDAIDECLPDYIVATLRAAIPMMDRRLRGFASEDSVLTAVESRSSSPVRVTRDERLQSVGVAGLWPAGEGAGYAGGIMSAATDGLRIAAGICEWAK